ncbi:MAG: class II glutamine amidotransferase [Candidatus Cloacimonetes bacterium]|nr:class II glutamine amidotransferase [Candidatus Cloacimonadota bacterium]
METRKIKKIIILLSILIFIIAVGLFADCRLFIMLGRGDYTLSEYYNGIRLYYCLEELQDQGCNGSSHPYDNPDGWGLVYYLPENTEIAGGEWSENMACEGTEFDDFQTIIENAGVHLVMGHVRKASSGSPSIPDPHPFIWHEDGIDYTFAHNGTVDPDDLSTITNWLEPPYNNPQTDVDSEIYFLWLMQNIDENDWNVLEGLHDALGSISSQEWDKNFVFSDGIDIYAYRNATDSQHELCYLTKGLEQTYNCRIVMSTFPNIGNRDIPNDALLYYPSVGRTALFENFSYTTPNYKRTLYEGWNWESFPLIQDPSGVWDAEDILEPLEDWGVTEVIAQDGYMEYDPYNEIWQHFPETFVDVNWNELYKIKIGPTPYNMGREYYTEGYIRPPDEPTVVGLQAGQKYWVSYTLLPTQNMDNAFGAHWDKVKSVKYRDWLYLDMTEIRGGSEESEPVPSMKMRALEFGKGYIIKMKEDIPSFTWNYSHIPADEIPDRKESQFFTYQEKANYEAVDIMEVDSVDNVLEIGVFQNEECVGAVVVDSLPVQLLAYTVPGQGGELTFQIVEGARTISEVKQYSVYDFNERRYVNRPIIAGHQEYSLVRLHKGDYEITTPEASISLMQNLPNPFRHTTAISYSILEPSEIELSIYNIKGQKIRVLVQGEIEKGTYNVIWDGKDEKGNSVSSGIYFYKLVAGEQSIQKKLLLMK